MPDERHVGRGQTRDQRIAAIARRRKNLLRHQELIDAGFTKDSIARAVNAGRLQRRHRGVYVLGAGILLPWAREHAAVLTFGEGAVAAGAMAARIWGLQVRSASVLEVAVTHNARSRDGIRVRRVAQLRPGIETTTKHGVPITTPAQTFADMAASLSLTNLARGVEDAVARDVVSRAKLEEASGRLDGRPGAPAFRAVLAAVDPAFTRSKAERLTLELIRRAGLRPVRANERVAGYEVDLYFPEQRVALEFDSWEFHSSPEAFERDRAKQNALLAAGVPLLRLTKARLVSDAYAVVAEVAATLARRP